MASKDLNVVLGLRIENFQKNLSKAQRQINKFGRDMQRLGSNLTQTLTLPIIGEHRLGNRRFSAPILHKRRRS